MGVARSKFNTVSVVAVATAVIAAGSLSACSRGDDTTAPAAGSTVTLVTHNSFAIDDDLAAAFEAETGFVLEVVLLGNAGAVANQIVLTADSPLGDVVFGIDNTFASRVLNSAALDALPAADVTALPTSIRDGVLADGALIPMTFSDVCLNTDVAWFQEHGITEPETFEDLLHPRMGGLTVVLNPASSSPGLAFLLATISAFGDPTDSAVGGGWPDFWRALRYNDAVVAASWSEGYWGEFSGAGEGGTRPIIVSYSSSPAWTMSDDGTYSTTRALLDTCFRQIEFAGVLAGAANLEGARALVRFLAGIDFQASIPNTMFMNPADTSVPLPEDWARFAPLAPTTFEVSPDDIEANRERWIDEWTEIFGG